MVVDNIATAAFLNTTVAYNEAYSKDGGYAYSGTMTATYSNRWADEWDAQDEAGREVSKLDPEYTDTAFVDAADWDLHLPKTSALVDAGDPTISDVDWSRSDIGAYGGPEGGW